MPSSPRKRKLRICFPPDELTAEVIAYARAALQHSDAILEASERLNVKVDHLLAGLSNAILFLAHEEEQKHTRY